MSLGGTLGLGSDLWEYAGMNRSFFGNAFEHLYIIWITTIWKSSPTHSHVQRVAALLR